MNGHLILQAAKALAALEHDGISRKGAGEPYFNHVERVADNVWGWRRKSLAYLHDVIEDAPDPDNMTMILQRVFHSAGQKFVTDLLCLSRLKPIDGEKPTYAEFIEKIVAWNDLDVLHVKLADINDNLSDLDNIPGAEGLQKRYIKAKARIELAIAEREES